MIVLGVIPVAAVAAATDSTIAGDSKAVTPNTEPNEETQANEFEKKSGRTYLVPELEDVGFQVSNDRNKYKNRISFSPGFGALGSQDLFAFRLGYAPNVWLGYEVAMGHNPAASLHAVLHTFNVILRYPVPWRIQPYATLGYGMITVYPGKAINADPVSKNTLTAGGGLEFYVRDDIALRGEVRSATVLGQQLGVDGTVAYDYLEYTIGFSFFRSVGN